MHRSVKTLFEAEAMAEGRGVTVYRSIGRKGMMNLDPFLLLDEMELPRDASGAGFPEHPHRGFETVTYMLSGRMKHGDRAGNAGEIGPGDAQWMTAGRGIVHSEMPVASGEDVRGFQLWVNLPAELKMIPPRYQDVAAESMPDVTGQGYRARLIAGTLGGKAGPVTDIAVKPLYADITMTASEAVIDIPSGHTAFIYGISGGLNIQDQPVPARTLAVLGDGDQVTVAARPGARFLLVAAAPIQEPVARYGPFVMNTRKEIMATLDDWDQGRFLSV